MYAYVLYYVLYKALTRGVCRNCVSWEVGGGQGEGNGCGV